MVIISLLFIICSALTPALCCDWLRHYGHLSNNSISFIKLMGGQLTEQECPVPFPVKLYRRIRKDKVESQLVFIRDSLDLILGLYRHDNLSSAAWDTDKTNHFLMTLDRQTDGLNNCVSTNRPADSRLRKYYRTLARSTLHHSGGSAASWELIRKETKLHLAQLDLLVGTIRGRSTPSQQHH